MKRERERVMGNSFGCSASGERLVSAARDGDLVEAKMLLECNPCLAKYSTFGGLNSPLHFAASKGHNEVSILNLNHFFFFFRFFHFGEFLFLPVFFDSLLILFIWVSLRLWHCCLKMELM